MTIPTSALRQLAEASAAHVADPNNDNYATYLLRQAELAWGNPATVAAVSGELVRLRDENDRLRAEIDDLRISVIAFGGPAMVETARERGLPRGHLYSAHYDILERAGARMDSFTRGECDAS